VSGSGLAATLDKIGRQRQKIKIDYPERFRASTEPQMAETLESRAAFSLRFGVSRAQNQSASPSALT
jgi:hypothetical protein